MSEPVVPDLQTQGEPWIRLLNAMHYCSKDSERRHVIQVCHQEIDTVLRSLRQDVERLSHENETLRRLLRASDPSDAGRDRI